MTSHSTRRTFLKTAATAGAAGPALAAPGPALPDANIYSRLGLRPLINGVGVVTHLGGSIMPPEVVRAMEEASKYFIPLAELQKKVGARIAELLGEAVFRKGGGHGYTRFPQDFNNGHALKFRFEPKLDEKYFWLFDDARREIKHLWREEYAINSYCSTHARNVTF